MESQRGGRRRPACDVRVFFAGERRALAPRTVRKTVDAVLEAEEARIDEVHVTFLSVSKMRGLNRRTFGRNRTTDVIAFGLPHEGALIGDVFICPASARSAARRYGVPVREELVRLVVHGVLHVLGFEHPRGEDRTASAMWKRQEAHVDRVMERA